MANITTSMGPDQAVFACGLWFALLSDVFVSPVLRFSRNAITMKHETGYREAYHHAKTGVVRRQRRCGNGNDGGSV